MDNLNLCSDDERRSLQVYNDMRVSYPFNNVEK